MSLGATPDELFLNSFSESGISGNKTVGTNGGFDFWGAVIDASSLDIIEQDKAEKITLFPNPASDYIQLESNVNLEQSETKVYNAIGKQVTVHVQNGKLNVQNLEAGIYTVKLKTPKGVFVSKFVKN